MEAKIGVDVSTDMVYGLDVKEVEAVTMAEGV